MVRLYLLGYVCWHCPLRRSVQVDGPLGTAIDRPFVRNNDGLPQRASC